MNEVRMKVLDMSAVLKPSTAYALVLEEVGGRLRKLALIIGTLEAQAIKMAMVEYHPPRPFTHDLMLDVMKQGGLTPFKAVIYHMKDGIYYSYLYVRKPNGEEYFVDSRTSDVISLSMRGGFPLYVLEDLLEREHLRNISDDGSQYTMSMNSVDIPTLRRAMDEAIRREDYERACEIRDEIRRREKSENQPFMDISNE
ncbi:bifunctional nuclease family protein [uncultured Bacteroides sp.]|uniref:bifunctional nuclease family protein n=1 Tax=uncultured Bacteroides sp. TaxID=162156 RepID=UPI002635BCDE|nr:bifunctional nuclease family protein [uncultured Bacteroides sp.]